MSVCHDIPDGTMSSSKYADESFLRESRYSLMRMQQQQQLTDICIKIGDSSFHCHRAVLCGASSYFKHLLIKASKAQASPEIQLACINDASTFAPIIHYMYVGEVDISFTNIHDMMHYAELLQLTRLRVKCADFLRGNLTPSTCIRSHKLAKLYNHKDLAATAWGVLLSHFEEASQSKEFLELTEGELIECLTDDLLGVSDEKIVFEAVVAWTYERSEDRSPSFARVLPFIRLVLCSVTFLDDVVRREPLMSEPSCQKLLVQTLFWQLMPEKRLESVGTRAQERACHEKVVVMGGFDVKGGGNQRCWILDHMGSPFASWRLLTEMPHDLTEFDTCATHMGILVTGGHRGQKVENTCWLFNPSEKEWKRLSPMSQARYLHRSVCHGNTVYVMGGWCDGRLTSVEKYDAQSLKWITVAPMKKALTAPSVTECGKKIFVLGGDGDDGPSSDIQEYFPLVDKWHLRDSQLRHITAAASVGDCIYAFDGWESQFLRYDPSTASCSSLTQPHKVHCNAPALSWAGKIIVGGGFACSTMEQYDPVTNRWTIWDVQNAHHSFSLTLFRTQMLFNCLLVTCVHYMILSYPNEYYCNEQKVIFL